MRDFLSLEKFRQELISPCSSYMRNEGFKILKLILSNDAKISLFSALNVLFTPNDVGSGEEPNDFWIVAPSKMGTHGLSHPALGLLHLFKIFL